MNEFSHRDTKEATNFLQMLVKVDAMTINQKGLPQQRIQSHHRFITFTNYREPYLTSKDDRRNLIIQTSAGKVGDKAYFAERH